MREETRFGFALIASFVAGFVVGLILIGATYVFADPVAPLLAPCNVIISCSVNDPAGHAVELRGNPSGQLVITYARSSNVGDQYSTVAYSACTPFPAESVIEFDTTGNTIGLPNPLFMNFSPNSNGAYINFGDPTLLSEGHCVK